MSGSVGVLELPPRARRIPRGNPFPLAHNRNYLRVRGEYCFRMNLICDLGELPPRARRIHEAAGGSEVVFGTTSACAENT